MGIHLRTRLPCVTSWEAMSFSTKKQSSAGGAVMEIIGGGGHDPDIWLAKEKNICSRKTRLVFAESHL